MAVVIWDFTMQVAFWAAGFVSAIILVAVIVGLVGELIVQPLHAWRRQRQAAIEQAAREAAEIHAEANASVARINAAYTTASEAVRKAARQERP